MKSVKSQDDLKRLALARGASATIGKDKFNSAMVRVDKKPEPKAEPKPIVAPEPVKPAIEFKPEIVIQDVMPAVQASIDAISKATEQSQKSSEAMLKGITQAIESLSTDKPKKWTMTVNRDHRGILQSIDVKQG